MADRNPRFENDEFFEPRLVAPGEPTVPADEAEDEDTTDSE
jgi:hypothetical protein